MKKNRIISGLLSFIMILSLFASFPAIKHVNIVTAAGTNIAPLAQYYGTGGTNGTGNYGESNWTTYHTGKLNDGTIPTDYAENTKGLNVEIAHPDINNAAANVWLYVYFKLDKTYSVSSVNVYMNFRNATSRAYPDQVTIGVGSSETSTTSLGTVTSSSYNTSVMKFTASGSLSGNYVVIGLHVPSGSSVICCSEVEIYGSVPTTGSNIAGSAQYYGTGGTNGTGNYGEANWTTYHAGKLNDGVIPTNYAESTTGQNLELASPNITNAAANVWIYIYFKLDKTYKISTVNVYSNFRNTTTLNRAYPDQVTISVGSSESSTTSLGTVSNSMYNTSVKKFTASGSLSGNYVVIGLHVPSGYSVIGCSEVEIYGVAEQTVEPTPTLGTPSLSVSNMSNSTKNRSGRYATYTVPTFTWGAVANATSYDVYLNGTKVVSDTTSTSYTPSSLTPFDQYGKGDNRSSEKVYVVAKASGYTNGTSGTVEFLYVPKPTDRNGNEVTSADFIIDAGHGGTDSGAVLDTRYEKNDNLNLALKVGSLLEAAGFTVAYTRTTDVFHSVSTKAAKAHAGNFRAFLCFHRNSATGAIGSEYYAYSSDTASKALSAAIEAEAVSDAIWKNRGQKTNDSLGILLGNVNIPTVLLEIGFISTASDNTLFDTYFNENAQSIARGAMKYLGYSIGYTGYVDSPTSTAVSGGAVSFSATAGNYGSSANLSVAGWLLNSYGISKYQYSTDGSTWIDANAYDRSGELGAYTSFANKANAGYSMNISTAGWAIGTYNVQLRAVSNWETTTKYNQLLPIANISLSVTDTIPSYTVRFLVDGVAVSTQTIKMGGAATAPANPTKEGYNFSNWDKAYTNITADTDINAVFTPKNYTVRFLVDGEVFDTQTVAYGNAATDPGVPTKEGYNFSNWDKAYTNITADTDINAVFTPKNYTVRFLVDVEVFDTQTVAYGNAATDPGVPTKEGYNFSNWDKSYANITADTDINAVFTPKNYTVRFLVDGEVFDTQTVAYGNDATDPGVPTKEGYNFSNWDKSYANITADTDINAVFTKQSFSVVFYADGVVISEQTVEYGDAATAPSNIPAKPGYIANGFDKSFDVVTGALEINVVYDYDASQWFTVEYVVPDTVSAIGALSFGPFVVGTAWTDANITAPVVNDNGSYVFVGWDKDAPETINENLVFTAVVELQGDVKVSFACDIGGVIYHVDNGTTVVGAYDITVAAGTLISDIDTPTVLCNANYIFEGWFVDGVIADVNAILDSDITMIAHFTPSSVTFGDYTVEGEISSRTVTITVNSAISLDGYYMYVFNQNTDGTTTVSFSNVTLTATETNGVYTVSVALLNGTTSGIDVFITDSIIDFSSNWNAVASVIGINVLP